MSGELFMFDDFPHLVRHHVGRIDRVSKMGLGEEKLSILYFQFPKDQSPKVTELLEKSTRQSDAVLTIDGHLFLVLPATDKEGALHILNILEEFYGREIPEVIVTFPEDAADAQGLLRALVEDAKSQCNIDLTPYISLD